MSSKLDQSLDEITGGRRNDARRARRSGKPRVSTGGVTKNTAPAKANNNNRGGAKAAAVAAAVPAIPATGESKIIVSNLPSDVSEQQIKEYFSQSVGAVKKVLLNYNKSGRSVGVATIIFAQAHSAAEAAKKLDTVKVDGKPMKIEVILGAKFAPTPAPPKTLGERISQPKNAPKPKSAAAGPKPATAGAATGQNGKAARRGKGRANGRAERRPKPKSVEELDAEMSEYFDPNAVNGAAAGTAAPVAAAAPAPATGDATMEDEIL